MTFFDQFEIFHDFWGALKLPKKCLNNYYLVKKIVSITRSYQNITQIILFAAISLNWNEISTKEFFRPFFSPWFKQFWIKKIRWKLHHQMQKCLRILANKKIILNPKFFFKIETHFHAHTVVPPALIIVNHQIVRTYQILFFYFKHEW